MRAKEARCESYEVIHFRHCRSSRQVISPSEWHYRKARSSYLRCIGASFFVIEPIHKYLIMKKLSYYKVLLLALLTGASLLFSSHSYAACESPTPSKRTTLNILSNSFPSINYLAEQMESCSKDNLRIRAKLTTDHLELKRLALSAPGKPTYQIVQLANSQFLEYVQRGWLAPITQYVKQYKSRYNFDDIPESMWEAATYNGEIYAIPVQQNLQHFFYRKDLFDKHNIKVPQNYGDVLKAAAKLQKNEPGMRHPITQAFGRGWNLATEFTNIYVSMGGEFFDDDLNPVFHKDRAGRNAIKLMSDMLPYMSPNALSLSTDDVMVAFQQSQAAMGNVWASRAANMDDDKVSQVVGKVQFASAPFARRRGIPAATGWWDGYAIPANVPASERDLIFQVIASSTDEESMRGAGGLAFFSRESITTQPDLVRKNRYWPALLETTKKGAVPFPGSPYFNIVHTALGTAVADALAGDLSARDALDRAAQEYTKEATAKGLIR